MSSPRPIWIQLNPRELATILAALRFHQDEHLQGTGPIADRVVRVIATEGGTIKPLNFAEATHLCQRLRRYRKAPVGLYIEPPEKEPGDQPLFRVIYTIDVAADNAQAAASEARRIMFDPQSLPPVLEIMDHSGHVTVVDLSAT